MLYWRLYATRTSRCWPFPDTRSAGGDKHIGVGLFASLGTLLKLVVAADLPPLAVPDQGLTVIRKVAITA